MKMPDNRLIGIAFGVLGLALASAAAPASPATTSVPAPPLPKIQSLKLEPPTLTLKDGRDERRVLVLGKTEGDSFIDLTPEATFKSEAPCVEVAPDGYMRPKSKGSAEVVVKAAGLETKLTVQVEGAEVPPVRFVREVQPILSKAGCNQGTCHG